MQLKLHLVDAFGPESMISYYLTKHSACVTHGLDQGAALWLVQF